MLTYIPLPIRGYNILPTGREIMAFGAAWARFERSIKFWAFTITRDRDHEDDLVEEAMITLWNADPTRWNFRNHEHFLFMSEKLYNRMIDVWGEHKRSKGMVEAEAGLTRDEVRRATEATFRKTLMHGVLQR